MSAEVLDFGRRRRGRAPWIGRERGRDCFYIFWYDRDTKRTYRRSTKTADREEAEGVLAAFILQRNGRRPIDVADPWRDVAKYLTERQRRSARARGIIFDISVSDVLREMRRAGYRCSVSGIAFSQDRGDFHKSPWAASIDRIDNRAGYTPDNIRVVCLMVNLSMNEWGHDALLRMARAVVASSYVTAEEPNSDRTFPPTLPPGGLSISCSVRPPETTEDRENVRKTGAAAQD